MAIRVLSNSPNLVQVEQQILWEEVEVDGERGGIGLSKFTLSSVKKEVDNSQAFGFKSLVSPISKCCWVIYAFNICLGLLVASFLSKSHLTWLSLRKTLVILPSFTLHKVCSWSLQSQLWNNTDSTLLKPVLKTSLMCLVLFNFTNGVNLTAENSLACSESFSKLFCCYSLYPSWLLHSLGNFQSTNSHNKD